MTRDLRLAWVVCYHARSVIMILLFAYLIFDNIQASPLIRAYINTQTTTIDSDYPDLTCNVLPHHRS